MTAERVFVGLGANLGDPAHQLDCAMKAIGQDVGEVVLASPRFRTQPWGVADQPWFINAVIELRTDLSPRTLLGALLAIEDRHQRDRERRWGPRTLDLDLLAYGARRIDEPDLVVPHPRLTQRRFVLAPWACIAPQFEVPGLGRIDTLLRRCTDESTVKVIDEEAPCTEATTPDRR